MDDTPKLVAEFNENKNKILRLDEIWRSCRSKILRGDVRGYRWELFVAERELNEEARRLGGDDDDKNYINKIKKINGTIKTSQKNVEDFFLILGDKEDLLREIQQKSGLGVTHKDIDADDWD